MPVYEYQCGACSHEFEEWQKIKDPPIKTCPKCGKDEVQRLISQTAFQLKGGGWYKDLYSSSKSSDKSATNGKSDSGSSTSASADSKSSSDSKSSADSKSSSAGGSESKAAAPASSSGGGSSSGGTPSK